MSARTFSPGDWVIFRMTKFSQKPGPRAENINPAPQGDTYSYTVDKFWIVREVLDNGSLRLCTRRGKEHVVSPDDLRLKKPNLVQRFIYRSRFKAVLNQEVGEPSAPAELTPPPAG